MSIITRELDRISIVPKGAWNSNNTYERLDLVSYNGSSYIARKNVPLNIELSNDEYWKLVAEKGANGTNGTNGTDGEDGNGISSIIEVDVTNEPGHLDTYRVIFTNEDTFDFGIYNGTNGTDGETGQTGDVGNGISSITEIDVNHSPGHTDIYSINFTNGSSFNFNIYNGLNGADGTGSVSSVDEIEAIGQDVGLLIFGNNAPTNNTVGQIKQRYYDLTNEKLYICTNIDTSNTPTIYTWKGTNTNITIDDALSDSSENPIQNKVLKAKFDELENSIPEAVTIDSDFSDTSENSVQNKIIKAKFDELATAIPAAIIVDNALSDTSENPVQNKIITGKIGTATLNTTAKNLSSAVNEILSTVTSKACKIDIASSYSDNKTYNAGDYVYYGIQLKQYVEDNNGLHWESTTIMDEITKNMNLSFQLTLLTDGWTGTNQIIQNPNLKFDSSKYSYIITPAGSSFSEYLDCGIYADDITTDQYITFHAETIPENNLIVNVLRVGIRKTT